MSAQKVVSREEWLKARVELLEEEKAHARQSDALAEKRRSLPWVRIDTNYLFRTEQGQASLSDLFEGRSQLVVQHFMFGPDWTEGCPFCSFWADGYDPMVVHMNQRDVSFVAVSRAPLDRLLAYRKRMGWSFPWVSSLDGSFNFDFNVSATDAEMSRGETTYNYQRIGPRSQEMHGTSVFCRDDSGQVFHTYSTYARGLDRMNGAYGFLDIAPKGRDEDELPFPLAWVRRRDEYDSS